MKKSLLVAVLVMASSSVMAADPSAVYEKACKMCHGSGMAGAPQMGDAAAWAPRLEKGMDALLGSVKNGLNTMPAGGMCSDCSDDDYKGAITHMSK
ncbi:MAG: c-type cytochrome [Porticoccus sp.]